MKVPSACTYRSRIANEVASSVAVPKRCVPRLSTLTSRRVFGSVPIVRYFMRVPLQPPGPPGALGTSLDAGGRSRSNHVGEAGAAVLAWPPAWGAMRSAPLEGPPMPRVTAGGQPISDGMEDLLERRSDAAGCRQEREDEPS